MAKTTVVRKDTVKTFTDNHVLVCRPTKWGNPFPVSKHGRLKSLQLYRDWLQDKPLLLDQLDELQGKILVCHCAPQPCHADILAVLADQDVFTCDQDGRFVTSDGTRFDFVISSPTYFHLVAETT